MSEAQDAEIEWVVLVAMKHVLEDVVKQQEKEKRAAGAALAARVAALAVLKGGAP